MFSILLIAPVLTFFEVPLFLKDWFAILGFSTINSHALPVER